jgi:hypothetical protein
LDGLHLPHPLDLGQITSRLVIDAHLQGTPGIGGRIRAELDTWGDIGDPQIRDYVAALRATAHVFDGELAPAFDLFVGAVTVPAGAAAALTVAVALRDPHSISGALIASRARIPARGKLGVALERYGAGALLFLEGDHDGGIERMTAALDTFSKILPPTELVARQAVFAALVGLDHPAGLAAGTVAQEWLRSVGAAGLERVYAFGLPGDAAAHRQVG